MAKTISDELNRLIQAKAGIKSALEEKGLTIGDSSTLDEFPGLIQEMEVGGGGSDTSTIIDLIEGDITSLEIPYGTTKIRGYAFYNASTLTNVSIPNTVSSIGEHSFDYCKNLHSISIPDSVISIQSEAFTQSGLQEIQFGNNVNYIGQGAFAYTPLKNFVFPNTVTSSNTQLFRSCQSLQTLVFPSTFSSIGQYTLFQSTVKDIIALKDTAISKNNYAFYQSTINNIYVKNQSVDSYKSSWNDVSTKIKPLAAIDYDDTTYTVTASGRDNVELYVDASLINSSVYTFTPGAADVSHNITVKSVDPSLGILDEVTQEVLIEGETQAWTPSANAGIYVDPISYMINPDLESVTVSLGLVESGDYTLPAEVTYEGYTFDVTRIAAGAFYNRGLTSLTIPASVTLINGGAASGHGALETSSLTSVTLLGSSTSIYRDAFGTTRPTNLTAIYVPAADVNTYKAALSDLGGTLEGGVYVNTYDLSSIVQAIPGEETWDYTLTPADVVEYMGRTQLGVGLYSSHNGNNGQVAFSKLNGNNQESLYATDDYVQGNAVKGYPPYTNGIDEAVINPLKITLYETPNGTLTLIANNYSTKCALTQDSNNPLIYIVEVTDSQREQYIEVRCVNNGENVDFKIAKIEFNYTEFE